MCIHYCRSWFGDFTDQQKTALIQGIFPQLGGSQLHWIAAQVRYITAFPTSGYDLNGLRKIFSVEKVADPFYLQKIVEKQLKILGGKIETHIFSYEIFMHTVDLKL